MDIERGIIKGLFYDYPIESAVAVLDKRKDFVMDEFLDALPEVMRWRAPEYTTTEADMMTQQLKDEYKELIPAIHHLFKTLLKDDSYKLLTLDDQDNHNPLVNFNQLFRWKDITTYIGEDLLTMSFVANKDYEDDRNRTSFLWDDVLHHDNKWLNIELDKGLSDLHAHWYATSDVFHQNWIALMNKIDIKGFDKLHTSQDIDLMSTFTGNKCSMRQICVAAAYLRYAFYVLLMQPNKKLRDLVKVHKAIVILMDEAVSFFEISNLQASISTALLDSIPAADGRHVDYCIIPFGEWTKYENNANLLFQGERALLYTFFRKYYAKDKECIALAPYFYLYLLLKTRIRREFVQINSLKGFKNFQTYQDRKDKLIEKDSVLYDHYSSIALHTSLDKQKLGYIEGRVTPNAVDKICNEDLSYTMFEKHPLISTTKKYDDKVGIIVHFIKQEYHKLRKDLTKQTDGVCRYQKYRNECQKQLDKLLKLYDSQQRCYNDKLRIVGIDAASTEMFCRPEVYGHLFRYAKARGMNGRTYHVGEDFLDLTDGLRAIDEAILFLGLGMGNRIGHALALGIDAKEYYTKKHYKTTLSKQDLLDDCVWTYMRARDLHVEMTESFSHKVLEEAQMLFKEIYERKILDIHAYWHSMLLRGDDPLCDVDRCIDPTKRIVLTQWEQTAHVYDNRLAAVYTDGLAQELYIEYQTFQRVKKNGVELIQYEWDSEIVEVVNNLQDAMQREIAKKQISIECNPTSNLKIGYIDRYDQHPLLTRFHPIDASPQDPVLLTSISTDDRGVFATSVYNEYSLMALALIKMKDEKTNQRKYDPQFVYAYIGFLRAQSERLHFKGKSNVSNDSSLFFGGASMKTMPKDESAPIVNTLSVNVGQNVAIPSKKWCIQYGDKYTSWDILWFKKLEGNPTAWVIEDFVMPAKNRKFWVGHGSFDGLSEVADICNIPRCQNLETSDPISYNSIDPGTKGTLRIYDDSTDKNWYIGFIPDP